MLNSIKRASNYIKHEKRKRGEKREGIEKVIKQARFQRKFSLQFSQVFHLHHPFFLTFYPLNIQWNLTISSRVIFIFIYRDYINRIKKRNINDRIIHRFIDNCKIAKFFLDPCEICNLQNLRILRIFSIVKDQKVIERWRVTNCNISKWFSRERERKKETTLHSVTARKLCRIVS